MSSSEGIRQATKEEVPEGTGSGSSNEVEHVPQHQGELVHQGVPTLDQGTFLQALEAILARYQPAAAPPLPPPPPLPPALRISVPKELKSLGAVEFKGEANEGPVEVDMWLNDVKIMLDSLHCSDDERLEGVVSLLRGQARIWWTNVTTRVPPDQIIWRFFLEAFQKKYIREQFITQMKHDFFNLIQGGKSVYNYECEFNKLARYASEMIPTERDICKKFIRGLRPRLKELLLAANLTTFQEVVNKAKDLEMAQNENFLIEQRRQSKRSGASSSFQSKRG
ncbi:uncharacterized protein LOC120152712 [Hibiscus syriacus]|uniref:uncharacterized protein LOC120152712 n=1 Tax=Hibiscus syriacus TaxID=106335 RepID=UPI001920E252|nr:uncharacterized protein LOC120152712 [Hibiscus syriacus]XP_039020806.1 uncharacterized protein LOC120152712 [Hibiscus syriacus]